MKTNITPKTLSRTHFIVGNNRVQNISTYESNPTKIPLKSSQRKLNRLDKTDLILQGYPKDECMIEKKVDNFKLEKSHLKIV